MANVTSSENLEQQQTWIMCSQIATRVCWAIRKTTFDFNSVWRRRWLNGWTWMDEQTWERNCCFRQTRKFVVNCTLNDDQVAVVVDTCGEVIKSDHKFMLAGGAKWKSPNMRKVQPSNFLLLIIHSCCSSNLTQAIESLRMCPTRHRYKSIVSHRCPLVSRHFFMRSKIKRNFR